MFRKPHPLFLICQTAAHVGSGAELGFVDLPIQRERHTGFPKFEASSLKGSLREAFERNVAYKGFDKPDNYGTMVHRLFGLDDSSLAGSDKEALKKHFKRPSEPKQNGEDTEGVDYTFSGALGTTDARLLLFPVKSMKGVFGWITCPRVLKQFVADMEMVSPGFKLTGLDDILDTSSTYLLSKDSNLVVANSVLLEEYTYSISSVLGDNMKVETGETKTNLGEWLATQLFGSQDQYWAGKIKKDIVILPDDDFKDLVNLTTEVVTRTKIDNMTGTVATGALFNEEYLPAESILYSLVLVAPEFRPQPKENSNGTKPLTSDEVLGFFEKNLPAIIQIGGNATLGKGITNLKFLHLNA